MENSIMNMVGHYKQRSLRSNHYTARKQTLETIDSTVLSCMLTDY